jgi:Uma2 family endonuclease
MSNTVARETRRTTTGLRMTVDQFFDLPGDGTGRLYELVHGEPRAQDAASATHGAIQQRLGTILTLHLDAKRPGCRVVANPGIRPQLLANWNHRIPELGVTCVPDAPEVRHLPDPILIVEVLSPTNEDDTWSNVPLYATLPTVMEILLVDSTRIEALLLRRGADGHWPQGPTTFGPGATVELTSIGLSFPLREAYRDTYLAE